MGTVVPIRGRFARLRRSDVLAIDDWDIAPLTEPGCRDLREICEYCYKVRSLILTPRPAALVDQQWGLARCLCGRRLLEGLKLRHRNCAEDITTERHGAGENRGDSGGK